MANRRIGCSVACLRFQSNSVSVTYNQKETSLPSLAQASCVAYVNIGSYIFGQNIPIPIFLIQEKKNAFLALNTRKRGVYIIHNQWIFRSRICLVNILKIVISAVNFEQTGLYVRKLEKQKGYFDQIVTSLTCPSHSYVFKQKSCLHSWQSSLLHHATLVLFLSW